MILKELVKVKGVFRGILKQNTNEILIELLLQFISSIKINSINKFSRRLKEY
jgi:hypothetical protein